MKRLTLSVVAATLVAVALTSVLPGYAAPGKRPVHLPTADSLIGAWEIVGFVGTVPDNFRPNRLHPVPELGVLRAGMGLRLFTGHYYTTMGLTSDVQRPILPTSTPTVDELIAIWAPFTGNGGRYEVRGDTVVATPTIAKNPHPRGFRERFTFRFVGDSLFLTTSGLTEKAVRLER